MTATESETNADAFDHESLRHLEYECDLVLKGGITSGVVYASALTELAKDHHFRSIAGTSAGAMGAVLTAAAEYGRLTNGYDTFGATDHERYSEDPPASLVGAKTEPWRKLKDLPSEVQQMQNGKTLLERLFLPQPETAKHFAFLWKLKKAETFQERVPTLFGAVLRNTGPAPRGPIGGIAVVAIIAAALVMLLVDATIWTGLLAGVLLTAGLGAWLFSALVDGVVNLGTSIRDALDGNGFGLANGRDVGDDPGITDWLHGWIQELAGRTPDDAPLTYGQLDKLGIELITMTTNLSHGTSHSFPFTDMDSPTTIEDTDYGAWAFMREDVRRLFPPSVAEHIINHAHPVTGGDGAMYLPSWDELPILMGARVSLSYPIALSAFPLRFVREVGGENVIEDVWLSDGGICSNLPVHLFDSPLPRRPTYAINLLTVPEDRSTSLLDAADARADISRPLAGANAATPDAIPITSVTDFSGRILSTMQNWSDRSTMQAAGVHDRICTITLYKGEGGMHLDMPAEKISSLEVRGSAAGENLGWVVRGEIPKGQRQLPDDQWHQHRKARAETLLEAAGEFGHEMVSRFPLKSYIPRTEVIPGKDNFTYDQIVDLADFGKELEFWNRDELAKVASEFGDVDLSALDIPSKGTPARPIILSTRGSHKLRKRYDNEPPEPEFVTDEERVKDASFDDSTAGEEL